MEPTPFSDVNQMLTQLCDTLQQLLGDKLIGVYLYGSLVSGDYDPEISDVDLLAAVREVLTDDELAAIKAMHDAITASDPARWDNRIEVAYVSLHALKTFRTEASTIAVISPGEPFHTVEADKMWLVNWYVIRKQGKTLLGPPPADIIDPIATSEFIDIVKAHVALWASWLTDDVDSYFQSYAVITLCRALYTTRFGEQVSKVKATQWAATELPEWATLINNAMVWRKGVNHPTSPADTLPETRRFINTVAAMILDQ